MPRNRLRIPTSKLKKVQPVKVSDVPKAAIKPKSKFPLQQDLVTFEPN